jgi:hypothetical protein
VGGCNRIQDEGPNHPNPELELSSESLVNPSMLPDACSGKVLPNHAML